MYLDAKLHKINKSTFSTLNATHCYQVLYIDFGFVIQSSKDREYVLHLRGLHGETCYVLCVTITATCFTALLFGSRLLPSSGIGSKFFIPFRGSGASRLCLLPSLRLKMPTLTLIGSERFVRCMKTRWKVLAVMN
jgi:hypothetical protein